MNKRYVGPIPGRRLILTLEDYTQGDFCCIELNIHINEKERIIKYHSATREYFIQVSENISQQLRFCPWYGIKFPKDLKEERSHIIFDQLHLDDY